MAMPCCGISKKVTTSLPSSPADVDDTVPAVAEKIWDRWLKNYWEMRLLGTPKPLSQKEATEMVYWSLSLGQRIAAAVKLVQQMRGTVQFEHPDLLYRVDKKGIAKSQPCATAELLLFFLESAPKFFYAGEHVKRAWVDLNADSVPPELLRKIREAMLALGHDPES